jgi:small subunit ribosomal protein S8
MALNDPIADFLTRIRNGCRAQHRYVDADWSKMKQNIADILKGAGFIDDYLVKHDTPSRGKIRVFLKYATGRNKYDEIPTFFGGLGVPIVSTSQGVLPGTEAKKRKIGGELLCLVW